MGLAKKTSRKPARDGTAAFEQAPRVVVFYVNGERVELRDPDPNLLLVDYLRQPEVGLTGTKIGCKQGGCGACTVMLSRYNPVAEKVEHLAVNSCLRPVCSLDGEAITTTEGVGSVTSTLSRVQDRIAAGNGSQCGFCTPGMVMSVNSLLAENPRPPARAFDEHLDGNLCRCTGYRPILQAARTFACDAHPPQELKPVLRNGPQIKPVKEALEPCPRNHLGFRAEHRASLETALPPPPEFPRELIDRTLHPGLFYTEHRYGRWYRPTKVAQVYAIKARFAGAHYVAGDTAVGIYPRQLSRDAVFIDLTRVEELRHLELSADKKSVEAGGGITLTSLAAYLDAVIGKKPKSATQGLLELRAFLLGHIANTQVRNVASIAGNLAITRLHANTNNPFPSDLFTALSALGASVTLNSAAWPRPKRVPIDDFIAATLPSDFLLLSVSIPLQEAREKVGIYKVARRPHNAHSLVNAGLRVVLSSGRKPAVEAAKLIFGAIAAAPFRAVRTEAFLTGKPWDAATLTGAVEALAAEIATAIVELPSFGVSTRYRAQLAQTLFYRFFVAVALQVAPSEVSEAIRSAAEIPEWPLSRGEQEFQVFPDEFPVSEPVIKLTAFSQASGEAKYTHDLVVSPRTLHGAFVLSTEALADFAFTEPLDQILALLKERYPGVRDLLTARDVPAGKNMQGIGADDPIFADGTVTCAGYPIAVVLADTDNEAAAAAAFATTHCIAYTNVQKPVLTVDEALALPNSAGIFENFPKAAPFLTHINVLTRPGSDSKWLADTSAAPPGMQVVHGSQKTGAQTHFYMETQAAIAIPGESNTLTIYAGTQDPDTVQGTVAGVLGIPVNAVTVGVGLVGGGFGGKTTRVPFVAIPAALGAVKHRRPVRIVVDRASDTRMVGKRHPLDGKYHALFDSDGRIHGYSSSSYANAGNSYDCTFFILDEMQLNGDSAYMIPTWQTAVEACRTNRSSNTAMRSFGITQVAMLRENAVEHVAHRLGMLPEDVRETNMYRTGSAQEFDRTPYGEALTDCDIRGLWQLMMKKTDFRARATAVDEFNRTHAWRKRGIAMIPLKYGIAYTRRLLNQGRSIINVYHADGSVIVIHGGVEIGQGIHTKMAQLAADNLNIPLHLIRVAETNTRAIANATSTGASTGSDLNGGAVAKTAKQLRERLEAFCLHLKEKNGEQFCIDNGIAFWREKKHWRAMVKLKGSKVPTLMWTNVVNQAWQNRIDLTSEALYTSPHITQIDDAHPHGRPYLYYTYAVGASEVEINVLTGESQVLRTDLLYEIGKSLNPALDIGQIEGGYMQGLGNMTCEQILVDQGGQLLTPNTWEYKLPIAGSVPLDFRVTLLRRSPIAHQPEHALDPAVIAQKTDKGLVLTNSAVQSSRTTGEPPFVLATSAFFAIKRAVMAARRDQGLEEWCELESPATVERIQQACGIRTDSLRLKGKASAAAQA